MPGRTGDGLDGPAGIARDSMLVAAGTSLARLTGVVRVIAVGAVLGPTRLGNAFGVTNALPNLVYYGFLAGSLVPTLIVPVLVRHVEAGRPDQQARVAGGLLGIVSVLTLALLPLAVLGLPALMAGAQHLAGVDGGNQVRMTRLLVLMTVPQVWLYALAGTGASVLYAHRRFALAAVAPAFENLGVIGVMALVALGYGTHRADAAQVPLGELVLLGAGATAAVLVHASVQWWGARRCGVLLRPRRGWREPALVALLRRAGHALAQAALLAAQTLALLVVASAVAGGAVAVQIALNFYALPIALVATPVGLAMLPRLARLHAEHDRDGFAATVQRGLALALFVVTPAAVGYVAVAGPLAHVVGVGRLGTADGRAMVAGALTALAAGLVGQTVFFIATQASYAAENPRAPLRSMALQSALCLTLCAAVVRWAGGREVPVLASAAFAVAALLGGAHLLGTILRASGIALAPLVRSGLRALAAALAMLLWVRGLLLVLPQSAGRGAAVLDLLVAGAAGAAAYVLVQWLLRAEELGWLRAGLHRGAGEPVGEAVVR